MSRPNPPIGNDGADTRLFQMPHITTSESSPDANCSATTAVADALAAMPPGGAAAGALAKELVERHGISQRTAQRWMHAAVAANGPVSKDPKCEFGTIYFLNVASSANAAKEIPPHAGLAGVPRHRRRDVAVTLLALIEADEAIDVRHAAGLIARSTGRQYSWATTAIYAALPYICGVANIVPFVAPGGLTVRMRVNPDFEAGALTGWAGPPDFRWPTGDGLACRELRRRLGDQRLRPSAADTALIALLVTLEGAATDVEITNSAMADQRRSVEAALRLCWGSACPAWLAVDRRPDAQGGRIRLHEALWM
jgi:hypothetical protein